MHDRAKHAEYMKNWRIKQKEKKDLLDEQIAKQNEKLNRLKKTNKLEKTDIYSDSWGREVEANLQPRYPDEKEDYDFSLWGSVTEPQHKHKRSHQDTLKQEFGSHRE